MTEKYSSEIAARVQDVRERMEKAADRAGRRMEEITLVGVTKTRSVEEIRELLAAGVTDIGENKVQELMTKSAFLGGTHHKTHLIGHLQRNKAKYLPGYVDMVQSISSVETVEALEKAYAGLQCKLDVLVEVNIGDETSKSGVSREVVEALCRRVAQSEQLTLRGLMAIPPFVEGEAVRTYFEQMRHLFVDIKAKKMDNGTVSILSMGMSSDFEYAILEGATMIRVGTDLFGPRQ